MKRGKGRDMAAEYAAVREILKPYVERAEAAEAKLAEAIAQRDEARATKDMHKERQQDLVAEVELLKRERDAALVHGPEDLITELERLRGVLKLCATGEATGEMIALALRGK